MADTKGVLYVVATPIGNLEDITLRAQRVLSEVDLILAEDTRHSKILLDHLGISTPVLAYHDHNEHATTQKFIEQIEKGKSLALISDAGTPLISDPGYRLVRASIERDLNVSAIPGPSAITGALSVAGQATDRFCFEGFAPEKTAARRASLSALKHEPRTLVFFESPHRIGKFLADAVEVFGEDREASIVRELTKRFESVYRGSLGHLQAMCETDNNLGRGEIVVIIQGDRRKSAIGEDALKRLLAMMLKRGISIKDASHIAAEFTGRGKNDVYELALSLQQNDC